MSTKKILSEKWKTATVKSKSNILTSHYSFINTSLFYLYFCNKEKNTTKTCHCMNKWNTFSRTKMLSLLSFIFVQQIKRELLDSQQKVSSLQELSAQLLVNARPQTLLLQSQPSEQVRAQGSDCLEAQEKVHVILNRLRLLLREVSSDLEGLERRMEAMDTRQVRKSTVIEGQGWNSSRFIKIWIL